MRETAKTAADENGIAKAQAPSDGEMTDTVAGPSIDYLKRFGYLAEDTVLDAPADDAVLDAPAKDAVLDSPMGREAVRAFQAMALLPESGEIDEATLAAFARPRCGVSDGIGRLEARAASSNFEVFGTVWNHASSPTASTTSPPTCFRRASAPSSPMHGSGGQRSFHSCFARSRTRPTSRSVSLGATTATRQTAASRSMASAACSRTRLVRRHRIAAVPPGTCISTTTKPGRRGSPQPGGIF